MKVILEDKYRHFNQFITKILILFSYQNKSCPEHQQDDRQAARQLNSHPTSQPDRQAPRQSNSRSDFVGQTDRHEFRQTESQTNGKSDKQNVRQTESCKEVRQTVCQTDTKSVRHKVRQTESLTDRKSYRQWRWGTPSCIPQLSSQLKVTKVSHPVQWSLRGHGHGADYWELLRQFLTYVPWYQQESCVRIPGNSCHISYATQDLLVSHYFMVVTWLKFIFQSFLSLK